ncbi:MAG TPA: efflux RND transporter periplasmic adaptor subunit [Nitrospirota bacterium]|nr:efflux RND transporter periplasmic adaptor subunit [Nitrospirota bacterium]
MTNEDLAKLKIDKTDTVYRGRRGGKRGLLIAVAAAVVIIGFGLNALLNPTVEVNIVTVSLVYPSQTFTLLNASGYVVAQRKAAVSSKATGRLEWLGVEEGSRVKQGEVIARLEDRDVAATREQAAANRETAKFTLAQARAELDDAKQNFARSKDLLAKGFIAQTDYDTAELRYKRALAGVSAAEASVNASEASLRAAEVAVEYTRIRAPFEAVVLTKDADVGDIVTPFGAAVNSKAAVVTIADMSSLQVEADVSESNLSKVKMGGPCEIQLDALPDQRFLGIVHMIVPTADRSKASVMVKVRFLDKNPRILPEMSAKVAFLEHAVSPAEEKPVLALHPAALLSRDGNQYVFLVTSSRVQEAPVRVGEKLGDLVVVLDGIKAGDKIVMNPPKNLKKGSKIAIKEG